MRKTRPTSETEFASVKLAFFHRITAWADALENRDPATAHQELRHLEVLSERLLQDELFIKAAATRQLAPKDLVTCLTAYLSAITDSMPYAAVQADDGEDPSPSSDDGLG